MKPYRVAIIGTGAIAVSHLKALRAAGERVEIVAAVDVDEARVKAFCAENKIPNAYTRAGDMLAAVQPDLVHILTPNASHFPLTIDSLRAGAWVYCEKPLCASLAQFDAISQVEAETGRYVSTVFQWRFGSGAKHLKRLIAAGELGRPRIGVCETLWYRPVPYYQVPWRGKWATESGGATVTLGIHLIDLFLWLMGDWQDVYAMTATVDRPIETENLATAVVRFENGAMGSVTTSALSPRQESRMRLDFERGTVDLITTGESLYRAGNANWQFSAGEVAPAAGALERWQTIEGSASGSHDAQVAELLDSMDRNERPLVSGPEGRRIVEFIACMYKSAFTGQPVRRASVTAGDPFYTSMNGALPAPEGV